MKRITACVVLLCITSPLVAQPVKALPSPYSNLANDPDLRKLLGIQEKLIRRLKDVDLDMLEFAVKNQDADLTRALFGMSLEDEQKLNNELLTIRANLARKHPELARVKPVSQCGNDTDHAFTVLRARVKEIHASESRTRKFELTPPFPPPDQCSWVPYSIALLACAWVGTLTVLFCMVTMWCVYCDTELTRISCPPLTTYK